MVMMIEGGGDGEGGGELRVVALAMRNVGWR